MKKLTRKLLLSVFSLGLAVVTLSTTTFAWYTSNASVTAEGVKGNTQADVTGSLQIADEKKTKWGPNVTLTTNLSDLLPRQHLTGGILAELGATTQATGGYAQFTVYVRTSSTLDKETVVYLKSLTITNVTGQKIVDGVPTATKLPEKAILAQAGGFDTDIIGNPYTVDAVRALSFAVSNTAGAIGDTEYSYGEYYTPVADYFTGSKTGNAQTYYNAVMNPTELPEDKSTLESNCGKGDPNLVVATIKAGKVSSDPSAEVAITFTLWLDGWDLYCFDACQDQSFTISFELTTDTRVQGVNVTPKAQ